MSRLVFAVVLALFLLGSLPAPAQAVATGAAVVPTAPRELHSFNTSFIDKAVDPCRDFYRYACGNWIKANPVPANQERIMIFGQMQDRNTYLLYRELKQAAAAPTTTLEKQYGTFFEACMNVDQADALGDRPMRSTLAAIDAITGKAGIARFLGDQHFFGDGFFTFGAEQDKRDATRQIAVLRQGGLTLLTPDYYLASGEAQAVTRGQYRQYLLTIFKLLGDSPSQADAEAKGVTEIETALAKGSMSRVDMRDPDKTYHPMTVTQLKALAPEFDWQGYFAGVRPPVFTTVDVAQPEYLKTMAQVMEEASLPALKSYLRIHAVNPMAPYLSAPFEQASFDFFNKILRGQAVEQPRWKRCTALTDKQLSDAVGQQWVKENFSPEKKAAMEQILTNVRNAFSAEIKQLPWMSLQARQEAERKLTAMRYFIGYPDVWRNYSGLRVNSTDFVADLHTVQVLNHNYELNRIGKRRRGHIWFWTSPTVDGSYDEQQNDIEIAAGILQPPFYSQSMDAAVNYGGIGMFAGHEMTHGFDDEGSHYDEKGNLRDWFTPEDRTQFNRMTSCEVKEYSGFEAAPGLKLNGKLSLGENTADNGGLRIAYKALQKILNEEPASRREQKIDDYTQDQRFFISFAQVWCEQRTEAYQRVRGQTDPHPPGEFRVNGAVQNFDQFGKAFGCRLGQPMMPLNACHVW